MLPGILAAQQFHSGLDTFKGYLILAVKILFAIFVAFGMIRTIGAFITGNPNAWRYLGHLIIGVLIYILFPMIIGDNPFGATIDSL